jgi:ATP-dependent DNA helicase RecG
LSDLPVNLDDLLHHRTIESQRIEYKATWDGKIEEAVLRTTCAFANDFHNLNGGYIVVGIEEKDGQPILPPRGLDDYDIDLVQRKIMGAFRRGLKPDYLPPIFIEKYLDRTLLVIWVPAGDNKPYESPDRKGKSTYWIRSGSATIEATGDLKRQLFENAAKIPFDDRRCLKGDIGDISAVLLNKYLTDVRSHLAVLDLPLLDILSRLRLTVPVNNHVLPKNVSLLFFSDEPNKFFEGAFIEVVQFGDDAGGDLIEEKQFKGPISDQIHSCLNYLDSIGGGTLLEKISGQPEVERTVPYPYEAMREAIVNAVYHRSYEYPPEPIKIYLYPDRMEIISYPGPVTGISQNDFNRSSIPAVPARNRRIGEFLKDLRLAERRGTGIPKIQRRMLENGSPDAEFIFDDDRTYFRVVLPVHPRYRIIHFLREASHLWAVGDREKAVNALGRSIINRPNSGALVGQLIEYASVLEDWELIQKIWDNFKVQSNKNDESQVYLTMARILINRNRTKDAAKILKLIPERRSVNETIEAAILRKRADDLEGAHRLFSEAYSISPNDPKIIHEFAQTKSKLAQKLYRKPDLVTKRRINREVVELLRKAIHLADQPVREAWCWFDLARTLDHLREPRGSIEEAFLKAQSLLPDEYLFKNSYNDWKEKLKSFDARSRAKHKSKD